MGYKRNTQNGYDLGEVISALQKEIRRGNEKEAMHWALEMIPHFEFYLWRRLIVIANEDIGIANLEALLMVSIWREQFFEFRQRKRNGTARLILANTILTLCRSAKSRISDHFQRVVVEEWQSGGKRPIPDHALDKHTRRGRNMGRTSADFWLEEGCKLEPEADIYDPYQAEAEEHWRASRNDAPDWHQRSEKSMKASGPPTLFNGLAQQDDE
jgi:replication-associated recombination protein RarA